LYEGHVIKGIFVRKSKTPRKKSTPSQKPARRAKIKSQASEQIAAAPPAVRASDIRLTLKHFQHRREKSLANDGKRLYLRVGDEVNHLRYEEWGIGVVMEVMTSSIPGGTCLVRVRFQDGQLRCFNNDLDNEACCYYFGVRRYWNPTHGVDAMRASLFGRGSL
jgi:hypothetical protein